MRVRRACAALRDDPHVLRLAFVAMLPVWLAVVVVSLATGWITTTNLTLALVLFSITLQVVTGYQSSRAEARQADDADVQDVRRRRRAREGVVSGP